MVAPQGLVRREVAFRNVADRYGVTPEQAESLVAYHAQLRAALNEAFIAASTGQRFQTAEGSVAKVSGLIATFLKFLPFGNAAEVVSGVINIADSHFSRKELDSFAALVPAFGIENVNKLTKSVATDTLEASIDQIKNLSVEEARKAAKKDFKTLTGLISKGTFKDSDTVSTGSALDLDDDDTRSQSSFGENIAQLADEMSAALIEKKSEQERSNSGASLVHQHHQEESQARDKMAKKAVNYGNSPQAQQEGEHARLARQQQNSDNRGR